ncbi:MAG: hypothetical protein WBP45_09455, partial [Daejeonella sp.]
MKHLQQASVLFSFSKKLLYALIIVALCTFAAKAQTGTVGIGTATPNQKAILDILSTTKGLLIPRMTSGQRAGIGATSPNEDGMIIFNTETDNFEFFNNGQWIAIGNGGGNPGGTNTVLNGTNPPTTEGAAGDFYINTSNYQIFGPKTALGGWGTGVSLLGGPAGVDGKTILSGTTIPDDATQGKNGDFYIKTGTTPLIYGPKTAQGWGPATGLASGNPGVDGRTILSGTAAPAGGNPGDFYLNTSTATLYGPKIGLTWPQTGTSLTGPAGAKGSDGNSGPTGPRGADGTSVVIKGTRATFNELPSSGNTISDGYLTQDGRLWVFTGANTGVNGSGWTDAGNIRGPEGPQGPAGANGTSVVIDGGADTFSQLPPSAQISHGYLVRDTGNLWVYTGPNTGFNGSGWTNAGLIQGPAGSTGAQGPQGP